MNDNKLQGVPDTLYIPLAARIYVSRRFPDFFLDRKSLELEGAMPDDSINRGAGEYEHLASVCRYYNLDALVRRYIDRHPRCNVVNLGCGLDTAYWRLQPPEGVMFYEMDLPEVVATRRRTLGAPEGDRLIAGDLFDLAWADALDTSLPTLLTVSGVFQYFREEQVVGFLRAARARFPEGEIVFDATGSLGIAYANRFVRRTGNTAATMHFAVDDIGRIAALSSTTLVEERDFFREPLRLLGRRLRPYTRIAMRVARHGHFRSALYHLRLNP